MLVCVVAASGCCCAASLASSLIILLLPALPKLWDGAMWHRNHKGHVPDAVTQKCVTSFATVWLGWMDCFTFSMCLLYLQVMLMGPTQSRPPACHQRWPI